MNSFKKIYYILIVFIALVAVLLIVSVLPIPGNYRIMAVQSGSMEPVIKTGSIVIVRPVPQSDYYKIGDIITFKETNKTRTSITHRIYDIKVSEGKPSYITKGDANNSPDRREITEKEVIGKVLFSVPYIGYLVDFVQKPIGFALIIIIPAVIIIGGELKKIKKELQKDKK